MATHAEAAEGHALRMLYADLALSRGVAVMPEVPYTDSPKSPLIPPLDIPKPTSLLPLYGVITLGSILVAGVIVLGIIALRPAPADNTTLISTALVGVGVLMGQAMTFLKSSQAVTVGVGVAKGVGVLHESTNSGFEEFARLIRKEAREAGIKEAEEKQLDIANVELRITAAVEAAVRKVREDEAARAVATQDTRAVAQEIAATVVSELESVDVATIQEPAIQSIADAVKDAPPTTPGGT